MKEPRVVVASRLYAPEVTAASFRMEALVRALGKNVDVTVLTTRPPAGLSSAQPEPAPRAARVKRMPVLRDRAGAIRGYAQYLSFDLPLALRLLVNRADAIVSEAPPTTGLVCTIIGWLTRRPVVYYPGDVWSDAIASTRAPRIVHRVMKSIESFVIRNSARCIAVSPEIGRRLEALGAEPENVAEVGNGIDTSVFRPDAPRAEASRPYFVYTGTMSEWQRPEVFVRALALLPDLDVEIRFFGQGSAERDLRSLADELVPGRVHFCGLVPPDESASWIRGAVAALVSIVPGIGYDFARPTKTYAAAAVGTPVLFAGASTGARIVQEAKLGEAVGFSPEAVAEAMRRLVEQDADGTSEARRESRVRWAVDNVAWTSVGARAARTVLGLLPGHAAARQ